MNLSVADLRQNYTLAGLTEEYTPGSPFELFQTWLNQAVEAKLTEPNAMTLATASPDGKPSGRIVLLKGFSERGFVFYTNYESQKGQQLMQNPWASLVFWWAELERQVRITGQVEQVSPEESDEYFQSRPHSSQLGAWASEQSKVIPNRQILEEKMEQLREQYIEHTVPRPSHWGGFRVIPTTIEFWQGRPSRLHDRLLYQTSQDGNWTKKRLSP